MTNSTIEPAHPVVDRGAFQAELDALRVREKAHTKEGDAIAAARRRLPMVEVDGVTPLVSVRSSGCGKRREHHDEPNNSRQQFRVWHLDNHWCSLGFGASFSANFLWQLGDAVRRLYGGYDRLVQLHVGHR